ncbi:BrnA antitoxin family protein [Solimicrobium silvestre]|uniref:BrnA antitoxin of type II toxin-antitoxin system n=1 Tax=Solimicrobium silvestre TaxID=2099400 RepID=A0A2S9H2W9_9BURK|nr:BrnA antitoxin family protein [Solimicrobium silvestre]PRC94329.1 hypothetical protein S2091_0950 [Solimicrobium silvestre]
MNKRNKAVIDPEMRDFEDALLRSMDQAKKGEYAAVHTPEQIVARRGRPVGSVKADAKQAVKLRFDPDVLAALRSTGRGWQTRVNEVMREWVKTHAKNN